MKTITFETSFENFQEMNLDPFCPLVDWNFLIKSGEHLSEHRVLVTMEDED